MLYAHLTKVRGGYRLTVGTDVRPLGQVFPAPEFPPITKRDARKLAKSLEATPWNF